MFARVTTIIACLLAIPLVGCGPKECNKPGCRYVYERRVESPTPPPAVEKVDHVMVLVSATGRNFTDSHCAALFCKVKKDKSSEPVVISWLPATRRINTGWRSGEEDGVNLDIPTTLAWASSKGATVERYGPYYIKEDLYLRAKAQQDRLSNGGIKFKTADTPTSRSTGASNNIHAISDILCNGNSQDQYLVTGNNRGRSAAAILKTYFDKQGYVDGRYRNEAELLQDFGLQSVRRLD